MKNSTLLLFTIIFLLTACDNTDTNPEAIRQTHVYFDYKISGEEGKEYVTCLFQFRKGGPKGSTILVREPGKVLLDGEILKADSARFTGIYYEAVRPVDDFSGRHEVIFTDADEKEYKEQFVFNRFNLLTELPKKIRRHPFTIKLKNIGAGQAFRIVMIDTAFSSGGINEVKKAVNNALIIDEEMLTRLKNGPVFMEISSEEEKTIQNGVIKGKIAVSYSLKRDFELTR
jgi:hypothetical protein